MVMPADEDPFAVVHIDVEEVAPGMLPAITASLAEVFTVHGVVVHTVLVTADQYATVRWTATCSDTIREENRRTRRGVAVHGVTLVTPGGTDAQVEHHIDWAGVMGQLGMTTGRPSATDPDRDDNSPT